MSDLDHIIAFQAAMSAAGLVTKDKLEATGELTRVHLEGDSKGSKNGWYILHVDGARPAGAFGSWKAGLAATWVAEGGAKLTRAEKAALDEKIAAAKERREAEIAAANAAAAARALAIWAGAKEAVEHSYLTRKQVASHGLRVADWVLEKIDPDTGECRETMRIPGTLLVPLYDETKSIASLQAILPSGKKIGDRDKDFLKDGRKRGCFFPIGKPKEIDGRKVAIFAEGYATCASIHAATGHLVIACFDAGNLPAVVKTFRKRYPDWRLAVAADNDRWTMQPVENPGVEKGREAARAVHADLIVPEFLDLSSKPTDFNDLHLAEGLEEVKRQIMLVIAPEVAKPAVAESDQDEDPDWLQRRRKPHYGSIDPTAFFDIIGHDGETVYFYKKASCQILAYSVFSKEKLYLLADRNWWEACFPLKGSWDKDNAIDWIYRSVERMSIFDLNQRRGRGAWKDEGRIVYHFGNMLMVDGKPEHLSGINSAYLYTQLQELRRPSKRPLSEADGSKILDLCRMFRWKKPGSADLLAGWVFLAPICGALSWRPHIWITGGAGSGKSTIESRLVQYLLGTTCIFAQGNSTEPGIRQELLLDALPVIIDESEQNDERERMRVQPIVSLARQSSSDSGARTLKGTTDGQGMKFHIRSMFCFAAIQVGLKHQADRERITLLDLRGKTDQRENDHGWSAIDSALSALEADASISTRMMRRALDMLPTIQLNIRTFAHAAAAHFGNQRDGDQYGTLLAGAWSLTHDRIATFSEAEEVIRSQQWDDYVENGAEDDESHKALGVVLGLQLPLKGGDRATIYELVAAAAGRRTGTTACPGDDADAVLRRYGIRLLPETGQVAMANTCRELLRLIADTPYATDLRGQLLRINGVEKGPKDKQLKFSGIMSRYITMPIDLLLGEDVPAARQTEAPF